MTHCLTAGETPKFHVSEQQKLAQQPKTAAIARTYTHTHTKHASTNTGNNNILCLIQLQTNGFRCYCCSAMFPPILLLSLQRCVSLVTGISARLHSAVTMRCCKKPAETTRCTRMIRLLAHFALATKFFLYFLLRFTFVLIMLFAFRSGILLVLQSK